MREGSVTKRGFALRVIAGAALLALVVPGGIAVGYHSGSNAKPAKTITAPFASDYEYWDTGCTILVTSCSAYADADSATGTASVFAEVNPTAGGVALGDYAWAEAEVVAIDSLRRGVNKRGYTIHVHVDRAEFGYSYSSGTWAGLEITGYHSGCSCSRQSFIGIWDGHKGEDLVAYLDFGALSAGDVSISMRLFGDVYSYPSLPFGLVLGGPAWLDVSVTLTKVEAFR